MNLALRIVARRADGYHLLDSIFVPIDLCDDVVVEVRHVRSGGPLALTVTCDDPRVPASADNLAARAAAAVLEAGGLGADVTLRLTKRIPPGSGLGGGSGNAAAVLRGLPILLGFQLAPARRAALALALGADVPFFLADGPARVRGIGEEVQPIAGWRALALVVAIPPLQVATAWAFRAFARAALVPGDEPARLAAGEAPRAALMVNDLERVVLPEYPAIAALKDAMRAAGAVASVMSGSGSAVVGLAASPDDAQVIAARLTVAEPALRVHAVGLFAPPPHGRVPVPR